MDSALMCVDQLYCKVFAYDVNDGHLKRTYSGRGQGANEMNGILYGSVIEPDNKTMWIFDSSNGVYEFTPDEKTVKYLGKIDFSWEKTARNDYNSPSSYNVMQMSDFGLTLSRLNDSTVIMPLSIMNRNFDEVKSDRYDKGYIFGKVNPTSLKVTGLSGNFPEFYKENPMPFFEFFDYAVDNENRRMYVNHAPDSLIYCYDLEGNLLHTLGFEPAGVNRSYTVGIKATDRDFGEDISHVGVNTGLFYDKDSDLLLRTSMKNFPEGTVIMQVYDDANLVSEIPMPRYFKLLGKMDNRYYGVRFIPVEEDDAVRFVLYRFSLD